MLFSPDQKYSGRVLSYLHCAIARRGLLCGFVLLYAYTGGTSCFFQNSAYRFPLANEPSAILKLKFHTLNQIPESTIHTEVSIQGGTAGVFHEALHDDTGIDRPVKGKQNSRNIPRLAMDAGRIAPGESKVTTQMYVRWQESRMEQVTYFDGYNWRQRVTRVSVERKSGCKTEVLLNVHAGEIYLLDFTWYSPQECQVTVYRQTLEENGFILEEVIRSEDSESILWPSDFRWGLEPWVWYPYRAEPYPFLN